ncbi:MAG: peroxidase family protein [Hyphomonadaceae bacterium]
MASSFVVNAGDLAFILKQIKVSELHASGAYTLSEAIQLVYGISAEDAALVPFGLRTVDGTFNNLLAGGAEIGAADTLFPRLLTPVFINENDDPAFVGVTNNDYGVAGNVVDADPRIISNLIDDQTARNPAAVMAALAYSVFRGLISESQVSAAATDIRNAYNLTKTTDVAEAAARTLGESAFLANIAKDQAVLAQTAAAALATELVAGSVQTADTAALVAAIAAATTAVSAAQAVVARLGFAGGVGVTSAETDAAATVLANATQLRTSLLELQPNIVDGVDPDEVAAAATAALLATSNATGATANASGLAVAAAAPAILNAVAVADAAGLAADSALTDTLAIYGVEQGPEGGLTIPNLSPDIGLSPGFNSWMTFFGQFFDHGLDLVTKGGNGTVLVPLAADDPLIAGADGVFGTNDDLAPNLRFMALTRTTPTLVDGVPQAENTTTSWIDQNQTYTSHASHQVFLREYVRVDADGAGSGGIRTIATGRLLDGVAAGSIANWAEVKAQAITMLGIKLSDFDIGNAPLLATDQYGKFIPGVNGYAQVTVQVQIMQGNTAVGVVPNSTTLMEGVAGGLDLANLAIPSGLPVLPDGQTYKTVVVGTGHAFLNDIAHHAAPGFVDINRNGVFDATDVLQVADTDPGVGDDHNALTYDDEMLDSHFLTGDGRGNENIALTTVHSVFHSEHNRLVEANKATILATGDLAFLNEWLLVDQVGLTPAQVAALNPVSLIWDGERLFQAARFATEMQYQHLVFEEFARTIQPNVDPFIFTNSADIDASIVAEFAHTVYRFGHSMLTDTVTRLENDLTSVGPADPEQVTLIEAFLNPQLYLASGATIAEANANIIRGLTQELGAEIDEFVVPALQSNLLGLPLDLPALNLARGRDTGVPSLNETRRQLYADFGDADLKPYTSWLDFAQHIKNPLSLVNFIAAYGTHASITGATTLDAKRDAAYELVTGTDINGGGVPADRLAFLNATGLYAGGSLGGLNSVDLWIGGLAEEKNEFGGMLGSTFNFVFETQMERLQNGDRLYYLSRTQGTNLLNQLEPNTFTDLVMRNTELGGLYSTHLNGVLFTTPDQIFELDPGIAHNGDDPVWDDPIRQIIEPKVVRVTGTDVSNAGTHVAGDGHYEGGFFRFNGGEHVVVGGTEGDDTIYTDRGIDTLWGDGGNDYLNAGSEADNVFGGEGDDIIEDPFGDGDLLRGNQGNDVIADSHGFGDILFGGEGKDFLMSGSDAVEFFGGEGDDFLLGGAGSDVMFGNEGNDWIEGGEGFDGLAGENSELFFNSPIIGHDVLNGQGNDTDYDGESGDDIMVQGPGIQRSNGMLGFDWAIHKGDPVGANSDLGISRFNGQPALILRDRFDSVEALSGWNLDDTLIGTNFPTGAADVGGIINGPVTDSFLLSQNVSLINGFEAFLKLTPGVLRGQTVGIDATPFANLAADTTVFDPTLGGDILIGGAGSDIIYGKAGNDLIDGDRWLNVRIEVRQNENPDSPLVTNLASVGADGSIDSLNEIKLDLLAGRINPKQLHIVRELVTTGASAADSDIALYAGARTDYTIVRNANGTITVIDNVLTPIVSLDPLSGLTTVDAVLGDEGTDTLSNVEFLRFTVRDAVTGAFLGFEDVSTAAPAGVVNITGTQNVLTADITGISGLTGVPTYQWESSAGGVAPWVVVGTNSPTFTVPGGSTAFYRVLVSYTDGLGTPGSVTSLNTARVGSNVNVAETFSGTLDPNLLNGRAGDDTINGLAGDDVLNGGAGNDTLNGGANADVLNGDGGNDTLNGDGGNDTLNGGAGNDTLNGGVGDDMLSGGDGSDTVNGNAGNDTILFSIGDEIDTVNGGGDFDTLIISGTAANNTLDVISAGSVLTFFEGGGVTNVEAITADLSAGVDTLSYAANAVGNGVNVNLATGSATGFASITGIENVTGGDGADTLTGDGAANALSGGGGNDTLSGGDNNDVLNGGGGADTLNGGAGVDTLNGGAGGDVLVGGAGADVINTGANNDNLRDTVVFTSTADYGDTVTGLDINAAPAGVLTDDIIRFEGALNTLFDNGTNNDVFAFASGNGANGGNTAANLSTIEALILSGAGGEGVTNANLTNAALVAAEFNSEFALTAVDGESTLLVINDTDVGSDRFAVWQWTQAGGLEMTAAELTLIGVFTANATVTSADFILA